MACEIDAQLLLAGRLAGFRSAHPLVDIAVVYVTDPAALSDVTPARLDAVAVWGAPAPEPGEHSVVVARESVHVVLREDDPLVTGDAIATSRLAERPLWMWPSATGTTAWELLVGHVRAPPHTIATVGGVGSPALELMIQAVQDKGGYAFAPASYLQLAEPAGVAALPLEPPLLIPLSLIWRSDPLPALQALIRHLQNTQQSEHGR